ncbi:MAG: LOG family protein [Acidimicrobiales bacterium]
MTSGDDVLAGVESPDPTVLDAAFGALAGSRSLSVAQSELLRSMLAVIWELAREGVEIGDLKIADAALGEMAEAFRVFRPYRSVRKVTMFGSARTQSEDPVYQLARDLARHLAGAGWMVVTGAGPGIMAAGTEGAGRERAFGVNIRLPHEEGANPFIAQDPKLVEMRYFFTRKLMLMKESHAYAVLPGGFGTQDECYELLTLLQTGKAEPAPVVLVETPGGTYWEGWQRFVMEETVRPGWVSPGDVALFRVANTVDEAAGEITGFYRNYHSSRWVGDLLVIRLQVSPSRRELADLNRRFSDIVASGTIRSASPFPPERSNHDHLDLARVAFRFDKFHYARLRQLIDALNLCTG